jgi:glucosamine--fructose-6-phosphate aminotransferase (isomerizing)
LNRPVMLVSISQSGESFEIKEIFTRLTSKVFCIGIVNEEKSTLGLKSDIFLPARAGEEEMTSTKTYVATTLVSYILGWFLSGKWDEDKKLHVKHLSMSFQTYLEDYKTETERMLAFLGDIDTLQIIARGPSFSTACQSALMFKEALHIPATGILGGEFRHGPMEMVSGGFKAIVFSARGETYIQSNRMAADIARYGGRVLLITNEKPYEQEENIMKIFIDEPDEYLFSVGSILPVQLLVDLYAKTKGFEAGSFNRGSKVTRFE